MRSLKLNCKVTWDYSKSKYSYMGFKYIPTEDYRCGVQRNTYYAAEVFMHVANMLPNQMKKGVYSTETK